jgi:hypothetical protein
MVFLKVDIFVTMGLIVSGRLAYTSTALLGVLIGRFPNCVPKQSRVINMKPS